MRNHRLISAGALLAIALTTAGCFESTFLADRIRQQNVQRLEDRPPPPTVGDQPQVELASGDTLAIDGMVGKINGRPIYTRQVFDPLEEQLRARGQSMQRPAFRVEVAEIIALHLRGVVTREKLLAEAGRDLNERELEYLGGMMEKRREEEVRKWGEGSPVVADKRLRESTGKGLEAHLEEIRSQLIVQRYLLRKFRPEINVTRKTVERYYERNKDRYSPPPGRVVRVVRAQNASDAQRIEKMLQEGKLFEEIASDRANFFGRRQGLISEKFTEPNPFAQPQLNEALASLEEGRWSGRIALGNEAWWLYLERIDDTGGKSLEDVQLQIEKELVDAQFALLVDRYRLTLIDEKTREDIAKMTNLLVEMAMNRYAMVASR